MATRWRSGRRSPAGEQPSLGRLGRRCALPWGAHTVLGGRGPQVTHKPTIAAEFEREMCCTSAELLAWLPGAARGCELRPVPDGVDVQLPSAGWLQLRWHTLAPRRIALITLPRLAVRFRFENVSAEARASFMRYFDLYTQRGGG